MKKTLSLILKLLTVVCFALLAVNTVYSTVKETVFSKQITQINRNLTPNCYSILAMEDAEELTDLQLREVSNLVEYIYNLSPISLESKDKVSTARILYDNLTDSQKLLVTNYEILTRAEEVIASFESEITAASDEEPVNDNNAVIISVSVVCGAAVVAAVVATVIIVRRKKASV